LLEPVRMAGLRLTAVDVSSFASATAYLDRVSKDGAQTAFVEIGEATVILSLLCAGRLRTSRAFGLAQLLSRHAEGPDTAATLSSAIAEELERMAYSAAMEPGDKSFTHLVLTGPGASNPELYNGLEKRLELEPLLYAPLGDRAELSAEEAADMSRATSLALRGMTRSIGGLNFLPEEMRTIRKDYGPHLAAGLVALVALQLVLLYGHGLYVRHLRVQALQAQTSARMPEADEINAMKAELAALETRAEALGSLEQNHVPHILVLTELTRHLPKEAWLEYLHIEGPKLTLKVRSDPGIQIASKLAQSPYILDPKLTNQQKDSLNIEATVGLPGSGEAAEGEEGVD
jgi:hypothetical protein